MRLYRGMSKPYRPDLAGAGQGAIYGTDFQEIGDEEIGGAPLFSCGNHRPEIGKRPLFPHKRKNSIFVDSNWGYNAVRCRPEIRSAAEGGKVDSSISEAMKVGREHISEGSSPNSQLISPIYSGALSYAWRSTRTGVYP
jgi:hypothetical protein